MSDLRFKFESTGVGSNDNLNVVKLEGVEALSTLYRFDLILVSNNGELDLENMLKNPATLTIKSQDGNKDVPYHGVLSEIEQLGKTNDFYFYRVVLVPRLWKLTLSKFNEIYLAEKSIPQIIEGVLNDNGLGGQDYQFALKDPSVYRTRSFVCQYRESSFNFICRWMEKEGLYYYFDHGSQAGTAESIKITDYKESQPFDTLLSLSYCQPEDLQTAAQDSCVFEFGSKQSAMPQKVVVQDYNYRKADLKDDLKGEAFVDLMNGQGNVMLYGENLRNAGEANRMATIRAEEVKSRQKVYHGKSTAVGIRPGHQIALSDHYRNSLNVNYMVTNVRHTGSQAGNLLAGAITPYAAEEAGTVYRCEFEAIEAATQFRALICTERPNIAGVLTAIIDDESSGKYAQLNEYGEYKINPLYDFSSKSENKRSAWVRLSSPYAGSEHGMHFPLLKGAEVIIAFSGGDPDQPVILGAVYNSENKNVITDESAQNNLLKTAGGNQLKMSDTEGSQSIALSTPTAGTFIYMGNLG